jgi:hypothetical protein
VGIPDAPVAEVVEQFARALETGDIDALAKLLVEDVWDSWTTALAAGARPWGGAPNPMQVQTAGPCRPTRQALWLATPLREEVRVL